MFDKNMKNSQMVKVIYKFTKIRKTSIQSKNKNIIILALIYS